MTQLRILLATVLALTGLAFAAPAGAAGYPDQPVKILVPYAPGGATDIVARVLADQLKSQWGQNVVVENKPGAFGILALEELAKAKPDGYTLMIGNVSTNTITPILYPKKIPFDFAKTIVPVTELADLPAFLLVSTANFTPRSMAEFTAYAKANPGKVRYATAGVGSFPHFDMVMFAKKAGLEMVHIPYKGGAAPIINAMATGDAQVTFLNVATSAGMIKAGHVVPIAAVAHQRIAEYPDIPTMAELGYPGIGTVQYQGLFARAGTPKPVLEAIYKATEKGMNSEQAKKLFDPQHIRVALSGSPDAAPQWLRQEHEKWQKIIAEAHIKLE